MSFEANAKLKWVNQKKVNCYFWVMWPKWVLHWSLGCVIPKIQYEMTMRYCIDRKCDYCDKIGLKPYQEAIKEQVEIAQVWSHATSTRLRWVHREEYMTK